ncbi:hypothetical protein XH98_20755 [Bradyrhizobium sp. CCBAU 51745]|nr:hypothetical protein [Bradyrhizobium sp. CCBAU 51745]
MNCHNGVAEHGQTLKKAGGLSRRRCIEIILSTTPLVSFISTPPAALGAAPDRHVRNDREDSAHDRAGNEHI